MHLRCLAFLLLFLPGGARRSLRIDNSHHSKQQQNSTLANSLDVSAELQETLIPGGFGTGMSRRVGQRAGALSEWSKQHGRFAGHFGPHRASLWLRSGPRRTNVALRAASGHEEAQVSSKKGMPGHRHSAVRATAVAEKSALKVPPSDGTVRVRFAPSPTGNLHVGGARTALFNWLFARNHNGKFILRVEDTDTKRSTRESEEAMIRDLKWLGLDWDEGPDIGGEHGPYRQSERKHIYKHFAEKLVEEGHAYLAFDTDEELAKMKEEQEEKKLDPKYNGRWKNASPEEVQEMLDKGEPYTIRFRVPEGERVEIDDTIRGKVAWDTDAVGDFVVLRTNGMPTYNFCVVIDDALMGINHVLRAEEHLSNTLRQALVYKALNFPLPTFAHVSLILAPDKSKLSKRHGATSVGQFKDQGYLSEAMVNYLSLLGWNDGTDQEVFKRDELVEKFSTDRITKSPAVFDNQKLRWMNGQHLRALPESAQAEMIGETLLGAGLVTDASGAFAKAASALVADRVELVQDAVLEVAAIVGYPLAENIASGKLAKVLDDDFGQIADAVVTAYEAGELEAAVAEGNFKGFINGVGKSLGRKGKRLFMPMRVALTGRMEGPDVGEVLTLLSLAKKGGAVVDKVVALDARIAELKAQVGSL